MYPLAYHNQQQQQQVMLCACSSPASKSKTMVACEEGSFFANLGKMFNATEIITISDEATSVAPRESATLKKNKTVRFFEETFKPKQEVLPEMVRVKSLRGFASFPERMSAMPRKPRRRASRTASVPDSMLNERFDSTAQAPTLDSLKQSKKIEVILDMLKQTSTRTQKTMDDSSNHTSPPQLQRTTTIVEEERRNSSTDLCRWSGSDHERRSLPPCRPTRVSSLIEQETPTRVEKNSVVSIFSDSFSCSSEASIATFDDSVASFAEWDKPTISKDMDFVPLRRDPSGLGKDLRSAQAA